MKTYYNEFDPGPAKWIRALQIAGEISQGVIDERSIKAVVGADLTGVRRAHFFAGIGGWELALKIAGWGDEEVWTGSCPCQPFSCSGKRKAESDERHLWPDFLRLIAERRPATIFGEQTASSTGRIWLAGVQADLEALGYAVGRSDVCSASVGSIDIRQRLFWVAHATHKPSPKTRPAALSGGENWGAWTRASVLRWREMAAPDWEIPSSWIVRSIDGVPGRVVGGRGFGNAINPILAAEFVMASMEAINVVKG